MTRSRSTPRGLSRPCAAPITMPGFISMSRKPTARLLITPSRRAVSTNSTGAHGGKKTCPSAPRSPSTVTSLGRIPVSRIAKPFFLPTDESWSRRFPAQPAQQAANRRHDEDSDLEFFEGQRPSFCVALTVRADPGTSLRPVRQNDESYRTRVGNPGRPRQPGSKYRYRPRPQGRARRGQRNGSPERQSDSRRSPKVEPQCTALPHDDPLSSWARQRLSRVYQIRRTPAAGSTAGLT